MRAKLLIEVEVDITVITAADCAKGKQQYIPKGRNVKARSFNSWKFGMRTVNELDFR